MHNAAELGIDWSEQINDRNTIDDAGDWVDLANYILYSELPEYKEYQEMIKRVCDYLCQNRGELLKKEKLVLIRKGLK